MPGCARAGVNRCIQHMGLRAPVQGVSRSCAKGLRTPQHGASHSLGYSMFSGATWQCGLGLLPFVWQHRRERGSICASPFCRAKPHRLYSKCKGARLILESNTYYLQYVEDNTKCLCKEVQYKFDFTVFFTRPDNNCDSGLCFVFVWVF